MADSTILNQQINILKKKLDVDKRRYENVEKNTSELKKQGNDIKNKINELNKKKEDLISNKSGELNLLNEERDTMNVYEKYLENTKTYSALAQREVSSVSGKIIDTEYETIEMMKDIYENIRLQNKVLRKTVKNMDNMFSTDETKTLYLKGKTDWWDMIGNIFFVVYYLLYIVLIFILFVVHKDMNIYLKTFYVIFFLIFPALLGFFMNISTYFDKFSTYIYRFFLYIFNK